MNNLLIFRPKKKVKDEKGKDILVKKMHRRKTKGRKGGLRLALSDDEQKQFTHKQNQTTTKKQTCSSIF